MRILHVTDSFLPVVGGIEVLVAGLSAYQRRGGHHVRVLTGSRGSPTPAAIPSDDRDRHTIRLPHPLLSSLTGLLEEWPPDVVHCHSSVVSPLTWRMARRAALLGTPVVVTMHSLVPRERVLATSLRRAARTFPPSVRWTAVSGVAARALERLVDRPVGILPNGTDAGSWPLATPGTAEVPTVVSVMRLAPRKRPLALVDVLAQVHGESPGLPWRAVIAGDGPRAAAVRRAVRSAGIEHRVDLLGRVGRPEVRELLASADLYLAPARLESFGIAALEARCSGVPVVAMRAGGVAEFVRDGVDGHLVDDDAEMAIRVARLLTDRSALRRLARAGRQDPPDLGWFTTGERVLAAYRTAIDDLRVGVGPRDHPVSGGPLPEYRR